jgi:NAD(P)-dependent dehydrogenase (short-subunit alcohol dehydrogenase family)
MGDAVELEGKVGLVTGAGSGMGRATVRRLADEGMNVCALDINGDAVRAVAKPIGALAITCDVSDVDEVDAAFAQCLEHFGRLDLAHLNAGVSISWSGDIAELDVANYHRALGVNLHHVVYGARAAVRAIRQRSDGSTGGAVVATSSIAGLEPFPGDAVYTIGKHGVIGLIRSIAPKLAAEGIAAHAVCPGTTDTGMLSEPTKEFLASQGVPLIPPEDIANAVVVAATSSIEMTGTCWVVNPDEPPFAFGFNDVPGPHKVLNALR